MATDGSTQSSAAWPVSKFFFEVKWDDTVMHFQEVSGLDAEAQVIEYRRGNSPQFSVTKMPGIKKYSDVTLKKGVVNNDNKFWDWFNEIKTNTIRRKAVTISLLDEGGEPTMVWTLTNAWPNKIAGTDLKAAGSEVAVETIVFSHDGLSMRSA